jgi:hypothetical protein
MPDGSLPVEVVRGVPVVTAQEQIDVTNAAGRRAAVLQAPAHGHGTVVIDMTETVLRFGGLHVLLVFRSFGLRHVVVRDAGVVSRKHRRCLYRLARRRSADAGGHDDRIAGLMHRPAVQSERVVGDSVAQLTDDALAPAVDLR